MKRPSTNPPSSSSKTKTTMINPNACPSFFRIYIGEALLQDRIIVPRAFTAAHKAELDRSYWTLRTEDGASTKMKIETHGKDSFFCKKDWERFARDHNLHYGDVTVFFLVGKFEFEVLLFSQTTSCLIRNIASPHHKTTTTRVIDVSSSSSSDNTTTHETNTSSSSHKKTTTCATVASPSSSSTNDHDDDDDDSDDKDDASDDDDEIYTPPRKTNKSINLDTPPRNAKISCSESKPPLSHGYATRTHSKIASVESLKISENSTESVEEEGGVKENRFTNCINMCAPHPYFVVVVMPSYLFYMNVPNEFAEPTGIIDEKEINLSMKKCEGQDGNFVKVRIYKWGNRVRLLWKSFRSANHIDVGDRCSFTLADPNSEGIMRLVVEKLE